MSDSANQIKPLSSYIEDFYLSLNKIPEYKSKKLNSYIKSFDSLSGGLKTPSLIIFASKPSVSEESFFIPTLLYNLTIKQSIPTAYYSLNLPAQHVVNQIASLLTGISLRKLEQGITLTKEELSKLKSAKKTLSSIPIQLVDEVAIETKYLSEQLSVLKHQGVRLVFINHMQLMTLRYHYESKNEENIIKILKSLSTRLGLTIIVTSLFRGDSKKNEHRPTLSQLDNDGDIATHADMVIFAYNSEFYHSNTHYKGKEEIIIAKGSINDELASSSFLLQRDKNMPYLSDRTQL